MIQQTDGRPQGNPEPAMAEPAADPTADPAAEPTDGATGDLRGRTTRARGGIPLRGLSLGLSFRVFLTASLIVAAVLPLAAFGGILLETNLYTNDRLLVPLLIAALVGAALFGLVAAALAVASLTAPLRRITIAVERVAAGEPGPPIHITGDDELARLADSHNRIAAESQRRNGELAALLTAIAGYAPSDGVDALVAAAESDARRIYGLIDSQIRLVDPTTVPLSETIPGDPRPIRAEIRAGSEPLGVLTGHLPATRTWEHADQDLLELFSNEVGVALRNAELFSRIESQNARLVELDAAKDEFLRSVSHNLQTPLTSIRAYVEQLRSASPEAAQDRRLAIVDEQADRLTRLVRQLLTVTRIEAGVLQSQAEVIAVAPRVRKAWEAIGAGDVSFTLRDEAGGWLTVADPDQLDQVLWALLDNAVKYGGQHGRVEVLVRSDDTVDKVYVTIADHGPGVADADRSRLFARFSRGAGSGSGEGTGLGLYVSRQLLRAMGGELWLEPAGAGPGASFTLSLPGERPGDGG